MSAGPKSSGQQARLVVIDGPAGAGKSTAARRLAARLDAYYLDTGAMYRACTLAALRQGVSLADSAAKARVVERAQVELSPARDPERDPVRVLLDGEDVSAAIRNREVTGAIHHLASDPGVREFLVAQQRRIADAVLHGDPPRSVVAEGRDLGSVVYPCADLKVYLYASVGERARRRREELGDAAPSLSQIEAEIALRDRRDETRAVGPLVRVPDAIALDTSTLTLDQVVDQLSRLVSERAS